MPDSSGFDLLEEGRRCEKLGVLDRALEAYAAAARAPDPAVVAEALTLQSRVHRTLAAFDEAVASARQAQQIARGAQLDSLVVEAMIAEGNVAMCRGAYDEARPLFEDMLEHASDPRVRGIALQNLGTIHAHQGRLGAAERAFAESSGCFHRAGYQRGEAIALNNHGRIALDRRDFVLAEELLQRALDAARALDDAELIALATLNLGEALEGQGHHRRAEELTSTALGYFATSGNRWREIECLRRMGAIAERLGDCAHASRCYGRALSIAEEIGARQDEHVVRDAIARVARTGGGAGSAAGGKR